jgi:hypothetical protein
MRNEVSGPILLGIEELDIATIASLYLYGLRENTDILYDRLKPAGFNKAITIQIDTMDYFANGGGRFINPARFQVVQKFFADQTSRVIAPGTYTFGELNAQCGAIFDAADRILNIHQVTLSDGDADYIDRAFIFGGTTFELLDGALFVVEVDNAGNARYRIENLQIDAVDTSENFDFVADPLPSRITNIVTEPQVDRDQIGETIKIDFVGATFPPRPTYDNLSYLFDLQQNADDTISLEEALQGIQALFGGLGDDLESAGVIEYNADGFELYYRTRFDDVIED